MGSRKEATTGRKQLCNSLRDFLRVTCFFILFLFVYAAVKECARLISDHSHPGWDGCCGGVSPPQGRLGTMADDDILFEDVYELCEVIGK